MRSISAWKRDLDEWIAPFLEVFRHKAQRRWAPVYLRGLLSPGDRKSVQSIASGGGLNRPGFPESSRR